MSYDKVKQAKVIRTGLKQTLKAIQMKEAIDVIVAKDADAHILEKILHACRENKIEISYVDSKRKLGKTCGIEVGAATVAIIK